MQREALDSSLAPGELDRHLPPWRVDVQIARDLSVVADRVDGTLHVVDEQALGARLVDESHRAGAFPAYVWKRGELGVPDDDYPLGGLNRFRKGIVGGLGDGRGGDQQGSEGEKSRVHDVSGRRCRGASSAFRKHV